MLIRTPWTSQPQAAVGLNPYWVAKGLVLIVDGETFTDRQGTRVLVATGAPNRRVSLPGGVRGYGTTYAGNTTAYSGSPVLPAAVSGSRSVVSLVNSVSAGGSNAGRVFQPSSGSGLQFSGDEAMFFTGFALTMSWSKVNTAAVQSLWYVNPVPVHNKWVTYGVSHDQSTSAVQPKMYIDGSLVAVTTQAAAGSFVSVSSSIALGNRPSDVLRSFDGLHGIQLFFDGFLSEKDHAELAKNPYQAYAPLARRYWDFASGPLIIRPAGDTATTGWSSTELTFYGAINEVVASDAQYITSPDVGVSPGPYTWTITPTPLAAGTWDVSVRCADVVGSGQIRIRFLDASSVSVGVSAYQTITGAFATQTHAVTTTGTAVYGSIEVAP